MSWICVCELCRALTAGHSLDSQLSVCSRTKRAVLCLLQNYSFAQEVDSYVEESARMTGEAPVKEEFEPFLFDLVMSSAVRGCAVCCR